MKFHSFLSLIRIAVILLNFLPEEAASFSVPSSSSTRDNTKLSATPPSSDKDDSPYYTYKFMKRMEIPALLYSIFSNTACKLFQRQPQIVPSFPTDNFPIRPVAIVTGSNTGVGFETAKCLVIDHGYHVIIASRSPEKGMRACASINAAAASDNNNNNRRGLAVWEGPLDLSDLQSVRSFAQRIQEKPQYNQTIDVLINNAGVNSAGAATTGVNSSSTSSESPSSPALDTVFTTNFLGHFLLTNLLLDKCKRIINLSSVMHHFPIYSAKDELGDIESTSFWKDKALEPSSETPAGTKRKTYGPSKLAALLFTSELQRRYGYGKSIAVNPGAVSSDIWRNYSKAQQKLFRLLYLTPEQGCQTSVAAAVLDWNDQTAEGDDTTASQKTLYLQPYRLPSRPSGKTKKAPFPLFEMLGPYKGYQVTTPRLPKDGGERASQALFQVCEELTQCQFPR